MAIYHCSAKIISRNKGRTAVGASAYRSGEKITNEYDGITHDYTRKTGVVYSEVMLCKNAPNEFKDRKVLWNEVEKIEKSKDSQLSREIEVALPKELNRSEQIKLIREYTRDNFVNKGMCADINIHDKNDGNPHAHIMVTMRAIKENGSWNSKQEKLYLLRKEGEKDIYANSTLAKQKIQDEGYSKVKSGKRYKTKSVDLTDWNTKEFLQSFRKDWEVKINEKLKEKGIEEKVDCRSYEERGIEKIPTIHEGYTARQMQKKGKVSDRVKINEDIKSANKEIKNINDQITKEKNEYKKIIEEPKKDYKNLAKNFEFIRNEYINGIIKLKEVDKKIHETNQLIRQSEYTNIQIHESLKNISKHEDLINKYSQEKANLGLFKGKEKKRLEGEINREQQLKESEINKLKSLGVNDIGESKISISKLENNIKIHKDNINKLNEIKKKCNTSTEKLKDIYSSEKLKFTDEEREVISKEQLKIRSSAPKREYSLNLYEATVKASELEPKKIRNKTIEREKNNTRYRGLER